MAYAVDNQTRMLALGWRMMMQLVFVLLQKLSLNFDAEDTVRSHRCQSKDSVDTERVEDH
jgi:ABC-type uncharacterized transport system ATPase subunit